MNCIVPPYDYVKRTLVQDQCRTSLPLDLGFKSGPSPCELTVHVVQGPFHPLAVLRLLFLRVVEVLAELVVLGAARALLLAARFHHRKERAVCGRRVEEAVFGRHRSRRELETDHLTRRERLDLLLDGRLLDQLLEFPETEKSVFASSGLCSVEGSDCVDCRPVPLQCKTRCIRLTPWPLLQSHITATYILPSAQATGIIITRCQIPADNMQPTFRHMHFPTAVRQRSDTGTASQGCDVHCVNRAYQRYRIQNVKPSFCHQNAP